MFTGRRTQVDLRFGKTFRLAGARRLQVMADVYNTFNSSAPVGANSQAGETPPGINTTYSSTDRTGSAATGCSRSTFCRGGT